MNNRKRSFYYHKIFQLENPFFTLKKIKLKKYKNSIYKFKKKIYSEHCIFSPGANKGKIVLP